MCRSKRWRDSPRGSVKSQRKVAHIWRSYLLAACHLYTTFVMVSRYGSSYGSFIPTIEDERIKGILADKEVEKEAEQVVKKLSESKIDWNFDTSTTLSRA